MEEIKFINDKVVKKILTSERKENREYLIRIISSVTGIDASLLRDNIKLVTSEIGSNVNIVDSTVDAIFEDNKEYINIEINYNYSKRLIVKNNVYVYQMILRQIKTSEDYKNVIPSIQINIDNYDLFGKNEFIYKSQMMEVKHNIVRDEMLTIYDINLDFLRNVDYNRIKKGHIFDLKKILYIFICDDKMVLNDIYEGDIVMNKVREDLDRITWERDAVLYYNPDDLNRQIIEEKVEEKVNEIIEKRLEEAVNERLEEAVNDTKKLAVKNMIENNVEDNLILKYLNIDEETLLNIKKNLSM